MAKKIIEEETRSKVYKIQCEYCGCVFEYEESDVGHRPWYPHGFVYCPKCNKPLRHKSEKLHYEEILK